METKETIYEALIKITADNQQLTTGFNTAYTYSLAASKLAPILSISGVAGFGSFRSAVCASDGAIATLDSTNP